MEIIANYDNYNFSQMEENKQPGLKWNPWEDTLEFLLLIKCQGCFTQRNALFIIAHVFNPIRATGSCSYKDCGKNSMQGFWDLKSHKIDVLPADK